MFSYRNAHGVSLTWTLVLVAALAALPAAAQDATLAAVGKGLSVTVSTNSPSYSPGSTVGVTALARYANGVPVTETRSTQIEIRDASGVSVVRDLLSNLGGGTFAYSYLVPQSAAFGTWRAQVTITASNGQRGRGTTTFQIVPGCPDADGDGHPAQACGGDDCNDADPTVFPGANEICGDGVDQDCSGADQPCGGGPHDALTWNGPGTCLTCHDEEAHEVHGSVMYQWLGDAPYMVNGASPQGKQNSLNSYCVSILGNWNACGNCHLGRGAVPEATPTQQQLENIDCLLCHQKEYRRKKVEGVFVPDTAAMTITMDEAVRTVHPPERYNCLQCHAKAGGGDAVKRGDLALAHIATTDSAYDVHMATTGANLPCQSCHTFTNHRVSGKGSDLRATDSPLQLDCTKCHAEMAGQGHDSYDIGHHTGHVACQTCHIPFYAKDAADTSATEATEVHRTWLATNATAPPYHPAATKANYLTPEYRFWNRYSYNALVGDVTQVDPATGRYPTSRPLGDVADPAAKLYPFKYKTAEQPITNTTSQLIAIDTSVFFATADPIAATEAGLVNMGLPAHEPYSFVETDTFQLLNHQVSDSDQALACADCHGSTQRVDLQGSLGYGLKAPRETVCTQCHGMKTGTFYPLHDKHVKDKKFDCSWCHDFSRPERGGSLPPG